MRCFCLVQVGLALVLPSFAQLNFPNGTVGEYQAPVAAGDFGKDAFGWLEARTAEPGRYVVRLGEQRLPDGSVNVSPAGTIRGACVTCEVSRTWTRVPLPPDARNTTGTNGQAVAVALPPEVGVVMPFRYAAKASGPGELEFRRCYVHWPMAAKVACPVDDPDLRRLWDFCQYTVEATSFAGVMVDGDRERIPYEGDIYINMLGQLYGVDGDPELSRRSIRHVLAHPTWPTEWRQHAIMCVWEDWRFTGSTNLAAECYDRLVGEKLMLERARPDGLLPSDGADIVDWPRGERDGYDMETPCKTVVNAFHCRNLREMADLAQALGRTEDARRFEARAERVRERFNAVFFDAARGLYVDGEGSSHVSLHANVAALDFGLVPEDRQAAVVSYIAGRGMACSPYFAQYFLEALCKYGRKDVALRLMKSRDDRSWLGMLEQGATMTMEAWSLKAKGNQDWNHAWGTAPLNVLARFFSTPPAWNRKATLFLYPPAFDFKPVALAVRYRFRVTDDGGIVRSFEAPSATSSLAPVWSALPSGFVSVLCQGVDAAGKACGTAGERRFWKSAAFSPGSYPRPSRSYRQALELLYRYVLDMPDVHRMETAGAPDLANRSNFTSYPSKMQSALVQMMLEARRVLPDQADRALAIARKGADYLISLQCREGTPLAGFTPTYAGDGQLAGTYAGMHMLDYPHAAGSAFLALYRACGDACYLAAATRVADAYLRLQGEDGTWFLKLYEKDGAPVSPNRLVPIGVIRFLEEMFAETGRAAYRAAADRAFGFIEKGPLADWNWEGQFEDIRPAAAKYDNLTHHFACQTARYLLKRFPGDARRREQVREILRFAEDQFVVWERPMRADGVGAAVKPRYPYAVWRTPAALEQYHCYSPIDSSAASLIRTFVAYGRAAGDETALAKARALGDSMVCNQDPSGRIRTYWICETKEESPLVGSFRPPRGGDWLNCMAMDAEALTDLAGPLSL